MKKVHANAITNEIAEICKGIIELSKRYPIELDDYFIFIFQKLSGKSVELVGKINAGWLNSELKEKDDARDLDVRAIFYEVKAKCMRRPSADQEKALRIKEVLDRYGMKITEDSYTIESAGVRAMLSDLNAPELEDCVASNADFKILLDNAEQSMAEFDVSASKLIEDKNERENAKSASVVGQELKGIINNELLIYLAAMSKANPTKYKPYADVVNTLIEDSNNKVRDRLAAFKRKKEKINPELN
ncbi:DUF6261 family protein [Labilibaculum antarcticum]|uniref:Uncharacterized protein n=1 Tax=Labilibaculum antarcticum TaxID=1717717 RepID=A0A1Y1CLW3_9BACT|nr:DUF6261 family protein [Labilibaculum antarcticum]BAX81284.1 hypothetical protein ALGA_2979 [Labilibaculum antarcticum]